MNDSDLRDLIVNDQPMAPDRRTALRQEVMTALPDKKRAAQSRSRPGQHRRHPRPLAIVALTLLALVGGLGAAGLLPWQDTLADLGCGNGRHIDEVASFVDEDGTTHELWTSRANLDGPVNGLLILKGDWEANPDTTPYSIVCNSTGVTILDPLDPLSSVMRSNTYLGGPAPDGATTIRATYADGVVIEAPVSPQGYWISVRTPNIPDGPPLTLLTAHDKDGNVIDRLELQD